MWYLKIPHTHILNFLRNIFPFLIVKRGEVQDLLRFRNLFPSLKGAQNIALRMERRWPDSQKSDLATSL